jgi:hypothetical protein
MILYWKGLKDSTTKFLDLINTLSKVAGYKINIQKSVAFLYTNNKYDEKGIKKTIPHNSLKNEKKTRNKPKKNEGPL